MIKVSQDTTAISRDVVGNLHGIEFAADYDGQKRASGFMLEQGMGAPKPMMP